VVEAVMKADYTDQVVRPALGEWVDGSTGWRGRDHRRHGGVARRLPERGA